MDVRKKIQNHGQLRKTRGKMINSYHFFFFCNDKKKQHSKQEKKEATETGNNGNE